MKKHKILIIHLSIYQNFLLAKGLSELGHIADVCYTDSPNSNFLLDHWENFDYKQNPLFKIYINRIYPKKWYVIKRILRFLYFIVKYDTFIYMSPIGILPERIGSWGKEIAVLKLLKKNILVTCSGATDIGTPLIGEPDYQLGDPKTKETRCKIIEKFNLKTMGYGPILHALQTNCKKESAHEHNFWFFNMLDIDEWSKIKKIPAHFRIKKKRGYTYIYHSFGNSDIRDDVKGTIEIKEAISSLKKKNYKIELMFFDKVPNKFLKYYQAQADIAIDQLKDGWHGQTGVECMALGKPIIVFYPEEILKLHPAPSEVPFINATVSTIEEVLENAINNPEKMKEIGRKTKEYCKKYHDYKKECKRISDYLYS